MQTGIAETIEAFPSRGELLWEGGASAWEILGQVAMGLPWWLWLMLIISFVKRPVEILRSVCSLVLRAIFGTDPRASGRGIGLL